jgi:hypothetical protein
MRRYFLERKIEERSWYWVVKERRSSPPEWMSNELVDADAA